ncbi:MAG: NADH:ubiquinone oxidoreductase subunit NDUFA12 [Rhodospirillaceae bacterium]|nr:NADH:ubiquinone oxidoreductase subunit NDUFA12 [Rhodospirillaceae bacterium]
MDLGTRLYTWLHGEFVGADSFGNRYFRARKTLRGQRERRWAMFNGKPEASKIPAEWHAWLHHTTDAPLEGVRYTWQKPHRPNLTGTKYASFPAGHARRGGRRNKATGDYEPWRPS